jgi:hypothetical protein
MKSHGCANAVRFLSLVAILTSCLPAEADPIVLSNVPAYNDTTGIGCAPTSIAMVLGYYDLRGDSNLFAAQGNALYPTANVLPEISSIASYCGTVNGITTVSNDVPGLINYAASRGYIFQATLSRKSLTATWNLLVSEINAGRPMLFLVDSTGNGTPDHLVPAIGYDTNHNGDGEYYACYTTASEDETPVWEKLQGIGNVYGVYEEIQVQTQLVPEPATLAFLIFGAPLIFFRRKSF